MTITFTKFVSDCLIAAGDPDGSIWTRLSLGLTWAKEALQAFPIGRPMLDDHTNGASIVYSFALPADFKEVISVEYPIGQQPPTYLVRKNRLDPSFYSSEGFYDVDHDYSTGTGWTCYVSGGVAAAAHIKTEYLAGHDTSLADDSTDTITVPDEFEHILIAYFVTKAWRFSLGALLEDPTVHSSLITQITEMVHKADENYASLVSQAQARLSESRVSPKNKADKFDRVY